MRSPAPRYAKAGLVVAAALFLCGCQTELYSALPEQEANEMLASLLRAGLTATKVQAKDGSDTLLIDEKQFATAVELLRVLGLPRTKFSTINDVFQPSGLIASPIQEQARLLWALGQELSHTVSQIDGVLTARVQIVLPDNDLLKRDSTPSSASVFIRYDDASEVPNLVPQIKMLVANSVQDLKYDKVSVVLVPVPHVAVPVPPAPPPGWEMPELLGGGTAIGLIAMLIWAFRSRLENLLPGRKIPLPEVVE